LLRSRKITNQSLGQNNSFTSFTLPETNSISKYSVKVVNQVVKGNSKQNAHKSRSGKRNNNSVFSEYFNFPSINHTEALLSPTKYISESHSINKKSNLQPTSNQTKIYYNAPVSNRSSLAKLKFPSNPSSAKEPQTKYIDQYLLVRKPTSHFQSNTNDRSMQSYNGPCSLSHISPVSPFTLTNNKDNLKETSRLTKYTYEVRKSKPTESHRREVNNNYIETVKNGLTNEPVQGSIDTSDQNRIFSYQA
jgi:hypothetical protein